jgi:hypothetical protein
MIFFIWLLLLLLLHGLCSLDSKEFRSVVVGVVLTLGDHLFACSGKLSVIQLYMLLLFSVICVLNYLCQTSPGKKRKFF